MQHASSLLGRPTCRCARIAAAHDNQLDSCLAKHALSAAGSVESFDHLLCVNLELMVDGH